MRRGFVGWTRDIEPEDVLEIAPLCDMGLDVTVIMFEMQWRDDFNAIWGIPPSKLPDYADAFRSNVKAVGYQ